ncbi:MAG TPA: hypothetical protein VFE07_16790 [Marmoricola sp.]|nr:hypothetical protein [Marmoricola sp.]
MEADDLASADDLWWSWAVLADAGRLPDGSTTALDCEQHVLHYRQGDSWASMQRIGGGRAVLWGRVADAVKDAVTERVDVLAGVPDWARSDAAWGSIRSTRTGFLAWYSRDGWDTSTPGMFDGVTDLITPLLRADPRLVAEARAGQCDSRLLKDAHGVAHVASQGAIRNRLKVQIHRQMRDTPEHDRALPDRPTLLARWARVAEPWPPFEYTVVIDDEGQLAPVHDEPPLVASLMRTLTNVLHELHRVEAGEESGGWLAARVRYDGSRITLDRAFDSLPSWYDGRGPTLRALTWEMQQRSPRWRPAWASLLPT